MAAWTNRRVCASRLAVAACFLVVAAPVGGQVTEEAPPDEGQPPEGEQLEGEQLEGEAPQLLLCPVISCYQQAVQQVDVDPYRAVTLCRGAVSGAPAQCFAQARARTFLTIEQAMELCTCAASTAPVECFSQGHSRTFLEDNQVLRLCSPIYSGQLSPGCLQSYYRPGY